MRILAREIDLTDATGKALLVGSIAALSISVALIGYAILLYWNSFQRDHQVVAIPDVIDIGRVPQGIHSADADLKNNSNGSVRILHVRKSCDCSEVAVPNGDIAPGKKVHLTCRWNTRGQRGDVHTTLAVAYSAGKDDEQHYAIITLRAHVIPDFTFDPERLEFEQEHTETKRVAFLPKRLDSLRLYEASVSHPAFDATIDANAIAVKVTFRSERWLAERGPIELMVRSNSENEPFISIPIFVETISQTQGP